MSNFEEIAIIARTRFRSIWVKEEMKNNNIEFFEPGAIDFQISWETKLALAILELAHNPLSSLYLHRLLVIVEEIGLTHLLGVEDGLSVAMQIHDKLKSFENLKITPDMAESILDSAGLKEIINTASCNASDKEWREKNIRKMLKNILLEANKHNSDLITILNRFLGHNAVHLITGHHSKGGEFDLVFFIGLEDDMVPYYRAHNDEDELAEERRIFYVGLTRARNAAYLTSVSQRPVRTWIKKTKPSRFLKQIPNEYFSASNL